MSRRDIYCIGIKMNRYEAMEYLYVTRNETSSDERYKFIKKCGLFDSNGDVLSFAFWFSERSSLPGNELWQFNDILHQFKEENFISQKQRDYLIMTISDHWDKLTPKARGEIQCLI